LVESNSPLTFLDNIYIERLWRPLNINASTCTLRRLDQRQKPVPENCWSSISGGVRILHLAASHLPWSFCREMKQPNSVSRC